VQEAQRRREAGRKGRRRRKQRAGDSDDASNASDGSDVSEESGEEDAGDDEEEDEDAGWGAFVGRKDKSAGTKRATVPGLQGGAEMGGFGGGGMTAAGFGGRGGGGILGGAGAGGRMISRAQTSVEPQTTANVRGCTDPACRNRSVGVGEGREHAYARESGRGGKEGGRGARHEQVVSRSV
jgi:hypothetical protein